MTDIVERLRELVSRTTGVTQHCEAMMEAADEIERLRECLFQMQNAAIKLANEQRPDPRSR